MTGGWKAIHDRVDQETAPRLLTVDEIVYILNCIKKIPSPFVDCSNMAQANLIAHLGKGLQEVRLSPNGIEVFKSDLVSEPGYAMGSTTGSGLGSINTQTLLNSFKLSGLADTGSREAAATENLVYARSSPKTDFCTIHFKNKRLGLFEVLLMTYDVDQFTLKDAFVFTGAEYEIHRLSVEFDEPNWMRGTASDIFTEHMRKSSCITELRVDPAKMATRGVSMPTLVMALQEMACASPGLPFRRGGSLSFL